MITAAALLRPLLTLVMVLCIGAAIFTAAAAPGAPGVLLRIADLLLK